MKSDHLNAQFQNSNTCGPKRLFQGAGVILRLPGNKTHTREGIIVVESKFAREISEIFFDAKRLFAAELDFLEKFVFFGRLGSAAKSL